MDLAVFNFLHQFLGSSPVLDAIGLICAEYLPYLIFFAVAIFVVRAPTRKEQLYRALVFALTTLLSRELFTETIRYFYNRPRPFLALHFDPLFIESSNSFPSGHAAFFFALAASLFFFNKKWSYWLFAFSVVNGIARVFAGVHWPSDILGGMILGVISAFIVQKLLGKFYPREVQTSPPHVNTTPSNPA